MSRRYEYQSFRDVLGNSTTYVSLKEHEAIHGARVSVFKSAVKPPKNRYTVIVDGEQVVREVSRTAAYRAATKAVRELKT